MIKPSFRSSELRVLPDEVHFALLKHLDTPEDWKNYSEVYTHLTSDDYFWKKLMVKFPELTIQKYYAMDWVEAIQRVDFNFTLVHAYETNDIQLARRVFDYGGNVYQYYGSNWLFFTITLERKFDMARLFLDKGFNINAVNGGETVLMYCVSNNDIEGAKFLLENGADVNVVVDAYYSSSALGAFCYSPPNNDMLKLLTDHGADYNLKNKYGNVALYYLMLRLQYASTRHYISDVKRIYTLFVLKTDTTIVNCYGRTFLHRLCIKYKNDETDEEVVDLFKFLITLFLDAGVPINAVDAKGKTAYDYVSYDEGGLICEFLRQKGGLSRDEIFLYNN